MTDRVILRLPQSVFFSDLNETTVIEWSLFRDEHMLVVPQRSQLRELYPRLPKPLRLRPRANVMVIVPSECFLFIQAKIPSGQTKYLQKAIPFLLEEQLAEPVEEMHFAVLSKAENGAAPVAAIRKSLLQDWLSAFEANDLNPVVIVPDNLCLPWQLGQWQLLLAENRALLRTDRYEGWACSAGQLPVFLGAALNQYKTDQSDSEDMAPLTINLANEITNRVTGRVLDALTKEVRRVAQEYPVDVVRQTIDTSVLEILGLGLLKSQAEKWLPNILQGEFKPQKMRSVSNIRYTSFAWAASIWMALYLGLNVAQGLYLNQQAQTQREQAEAIFRELFPQENRIVDLRSQLKRLVGDNAASSDGFITLLDPIGQQIANLIAKDQNAVKIKRVSYRQKNGYVQLELIFNSYPYVDELKSMIEQEGLVATIDSAKKGSGKDINARLRISTS